MSKVVLLAMAMKVIETRERKKSKNLVEETAWLSHAY